MEGRPNIADAESIIQECFENIDAAPLYPDMANLLLDEVREYLQSRYESTKEILYLQRATEIARMAMETTTPSDKHWLTRLHILGSLIVDKYKHTQTLEDLEEAICAVQGLIDVAGPGYLGYANNKHFLGLLLSLRFFENRDAADLDQAICIIQDIINTTPPNHFHRKQYLDTFKNLFDAKYDYIKKTAGLEEAIRLGQEFVEASPPSHPERVMHLLCLARLFHGQHDSTQAMSDIDQAVSLAQEAKDIIPLINPVLVKSECRLHLDKRYKSFGETADLEEAIIMSFEAVEDCPLDDKEWLGILWNLVTGLNMRYSSTRAFADIDAAVIMAQETIATIPINCPERDRMSYNLGLFLLKRYHHTGMPADLDESIQVYQDPLYAASLDPEIQRGRLLHLAANFGTRYSRTGLRSDIEESIRLTLENIESTPMDHPVRAISLLNLGTCVAQRFARTGVSTDLDEAIQIFRYSLEAMPPNRHIIGNGHNLRIRILENLSKSLNDRYYRTGAMSDLSESIDLSRDALKSIPPDYAHRSDLLSNLARNLNIRYDRTKDIGDVNEAIALFREALELPPSDYYERVSRLHSISMCLRNKFDNFEDMADLTEAMLMSQEALNHITSENSSLTQATVFSNHAVLLYKKYGQTAAKADLNEAIRMGMRAVNDMPQDNPNRAICLHDLGGFLLQRFIWVQVMTNIMTSVEADAMTKSLQDREIWTALDRYGAKIPSESDAMEFMGNTKYFIAQALLDLQLSRQYFIEALYLETAIVRQRLAAGKALMSFNFMHYPDAYDIAKYTIDLIPLLMSRSLQNSDKQSLLSEAAGYSSIAAAVALHNLPPHQSPLAAIECLEIGRGLIAGALFEQYDISALQKHHPELAHSFLALQDRRANPASRKIFSTIHGTTSTVETENNGHNKSEQELNEVLKAIRSKPNFQHFRLPPSEHEMLQAAACGGPIVILNKGLDHCDALLIEQSGLRVLELPNLSQGTLSSKILGKHYRHIEALDTLAWLWDAVVCPVLDALGFTKPPSDDSWPHVWWIPTGTLALLPLHAAGYHLERSGKATLDRVVSSYATSVKALIHSRRRRAPITEEPLNVVAVAMKETYGQVTLENADHEIDAVFNILRSENINCHRAEPQKGNVLRDIKTCQIFHFAGHGETHPKDPLQSKLLLEDWQNEPLTVASLLETDLGSNPPFLAYLSACGTGQLSNLLSADESIHLANAFQLAGFRHVIGTLWSVKDELCVEIAELTYKSLCRSGKIRDDSVSRGLHDAVREIRDRWVDQANEYVENESDDDMECESRGSDELRAARHAKLIDECEEVAKPLWIPYVHFGV